MSILDWSFVVLLSSALLLFLFAFIFVFNFFRTSRKYKKMKMKRPPKNKKKRRVFLRQRKQLAKKQKNQRTWSVILFLLAGVSLGGGFYSRNYQQNHLQGEDSEALVQSYYLLEDAKIQISNIQAGENPQKSIKNIQEITSRLASYGARKSSPNLKEDGQTLLNRHYTLLREVGVNLNSQTVESLQKEETAASYLKDLEKAHDSQNKVFKRFGVNEGALKKKK
ncbi:hypothetical protein BCR24_07405 [Enterococcus ureilyticus]|uniref:Uncharacterized protein n=2 Tax=Enterococcus TaxID=1350 RepID=A0A1E5H8K3_9ENTE|nr:hypothetical protein BCR24_07405 [Enterococcus ureilyticus]